MTFKTLVFTLFFIGVWTHGDFCSINSCTGGIVMLGRRYYRGLGGGGAANPSDLSFFFFASFPPGGTGKRSGTGFLCVLSKENFSSANVVTVSSFNQQD